MGRKTWDSIPVRFRPLKGRLNIVLSRSYTAVTRYPDVIDTEPLKFSSFNAALASLSKSKNIGRVFVIGGAEIYKAALAEKQTKRILLTRVLTDFECDTFFPALLTEDGEGEWKKKSKYELDQWTREPVPDGVQDENEIQYVFEMYERD
jgi:dihydrofolate reductase